MARVPLTEGRTKQLLKQGYMEDERAAIEMLKQAGSVACSVYPELRIKRMVIKNTLRELRYHRFHQVAIAGLICATRFKFF